MGYAFQREKGGVYERFQKEKREREVFFIIISNIREITNYRATKQKQRKKRFSYQICLGLCQVCKNQPTYYVCVCV